MLFITIGKAKFTWACVPCALNSDTEVPILQASWDVPKAVAHVITATGVLEFFSLPKLFEVWMARSACWLLNGQIYN